MKNLYLYRKLTVSTRRTHQLPLTLFYLPLTRTTTLLTNALIPMLLYSAAAAAAAAAVFDLYLSSSLSYHATSGLDLA